MLVARVSPSPSHVGLPESSSGPALREVGVAAGPPPPKLLDRVRQALQTRHYSRRTEKTYVAWIRRYILKSISLCTSSLSVQNREGAVVTGISPRATATCSAVR